VPERQNLNRRSSDPVVDVVPDAREVDASYAMDSRISCASADAWLNSQQVERLLNVFAKRIRCRGTIRDPPLPSLENLLSGAACNTDG
jgi:hypothetical protein